MSKLKNITAIILVSFLFGLTSLWAQDEDAVQAKVYVSRNRLHPGETFKIAVQLKIKGGWHINANPVNDEFLLPTVLSVEEIPGAKAVQIVYPKPQLGKFEYAAAELQIYSGETFLGALLKAEVQQAPGTLKINARINYQACNDRICLPPREIRFEIPVEIVAASEPTEEINSDIFSKIEFPKEI